MARKDCTATCKIVGRVRKIPCVRLPLRVMLKANDNQAHDVKCRKWKLPKESTGPFAAVDNFVCIQEQGESGKTILRTFDAR